MADDWRNPGVNPATLVAIKDMLGADSANNSQATTLVAANADGSIVEREEYIQGQIAALGSGMAPGTFVPGLGLVATKTSNLADGAGTDDLFTVTGKVLITLMTGEVTTIVGGAATMKLRDTTNGVDLCAATTIDTDAVGTMYALTSISGNILNGTAATPVIGSVPNITGAVQAGFVRIVGTTGGTTTISHVLDAADTGNVKWWLFYLPLEASASVAAAA